LEKDLDTFPSFFSKVPFIYLSEIFDGMMGNKNMLWKRSKEKYDG
jgi:hypothetical protein